MSRRSPTLSPVPVADALVRILRAVKPLAIENVALRMAHGRALARDLTSRRDQPPFDASAMDGYAVRSQDAAMVGVKLKVIGVAVAGAAYPGSVGAGEAVRIFTGAPVPEGADAVLIQENARVAEKQITTTEAVRSGQHVRLRALDFAKGEVLIKAGKRLDARDIGLAASLNIPLLPVRCQPRVAIFVTGDELVAPGGQPRSDQIISSNNYALGAFVHHFGGLAHDLGIVPDKLPSIRAAIREVRTADVLLTTGGASVGDHDLVRDALVAEGIGLAFWKIAMRPGKPLLFARRGLQRIIGLPGNPVSALVCARVFIKPLLDKMLGLPPEDAVIKVKLAAPMRANDQRQEYVRAQLTRRADGALAATPHPSQDSSMLRVFQTANGLIIRPPFAPAASEGEEVDALPIDF